MSRTPFYDPNISYEENYDQGPFGVFGEPQCVMSATGAMWNSYLAQEIKAASQ